jgi:hypothetical protein
LSDSWGLPWLVPFCFSSSSVSSFFNFRSTDMSSPWSWSSCPPGSDGLLNSILSSDSQTVMY